MHVRHHYLMLTISQTKCWQSEMYIMTTIKMIFSVTEVDITLKENPKNFLHLYRSKLHSHEAFCIARHEFIKVGGILRMHLATVLRVNDVIAAVQLNLLLF